MRLPERQSWKGQAGTQEGRGGEETSLLVSDDSIGLTANAEPGSGMGLRLVRMLANERDASVTMEGYHGTEVRITLR